MNRYLTAKLALAAIGVIVLIWGFRIDDPTIRWIGIGFLAVSVVIRFLPKRLRETDYPER